MLTQKFARIAAATVLATCISSMAAYGAAVAFDSTASSVYGGANPQWSNGQNGGFGFGPWQMQALNLGVTPPTPTGSAGAYIGTSVLNGNGTLGIDVSGSAWGLFARDPNLLAEAIRPFTAGGVTGDSTLGIGEQFILQFDSGLVDDGGAVGFGLRNAAGENRFEFFLQGNKTTYTLNIAENVQTGHQETGNGMMIKFTLTGFDTFQLDLYYASFDANNPATETFTGTLDGTPGSGIDRFRLFNFAAGVGGKNVFFNSVQVVPEPSSLVMLAAGALALTRRRSRR